MLKQNQHNLIVVELSEGIKVSTSITSDCIPALRSGFASYPANPRWNALKYYAWKTGRQWRLAFNSGNMVVKAGFLVLNELPSQDKTTELDPAAVEPRQWAYESSIGKIKYA